jgi:hypothetical protein
LTQRIIVLPREVTVDAKNVILSEPLSLRIFIIDKEDDDVPLLLHFHITDNLSMMGRNEARLFVPQDEVPSLSPLFYTLSLLIPFLQF